MHTVLVVEDEPVIRLGAVAIVEDAGFAVVEAADATEAIRILEARTDIRLIFTDVDMPGTMDGLKLANYVRNRWPPIKIIVASGKAIVDEGALPSGAFAFFTTEPNDVVGAVHPKAMPVILKTGEEQATWLTAPWSEAKALQKPLPDGELEIVHRTALKYLPGVEGIPSGDPLRMNALPRKEPPLL